MVPFLYSRNSSLETENKGKKAEVTVFECTEDRCGSVDRKRAIYERLTYNELRGAGSTIGRYREHRRWSHGNFCHCWKWWHASKLAARI